MKKENWSMIQWIIVVVFLATISGCVPSSATNSQTEQPDSAQPDPTQPDLAAALQRLVDGEAQEQDILGMSMAVRAADGRSSARELGILIPQEKSLGAWIHSPPLPA